MALNETYAVTEPARAEVDKLDGATMIEFGAPWCAYCQAVQPLLSIAFAAHPRVRHIKVEDGRGRRLGRSFGVKLWPTLIFLSDGKEISRLIRTRDAQTIRQALAQIDGDA